VRPARLALVHHRQELDLIPDLRVRRQIHEVRPAIQPKLSRGLAFGREILLLCALVHQSRGTARDVAADSRVRHVGVVRRNTLLCNGARAANQIETIRQSPSVARDHPCSFPNVCASFAPSPRACSCFFASFSEPSGLNASCAVLIATWSGSTSTWMLPRIAR